ncbi:MAG TPA: phenylalanine--tRNA ligase subunit alpha [Thermoplasmata archaeon]|nr:phenylalanine--tRNA ligase subunit alpha [Thermoplasmata archaeon]
MPDPADALSYLEKRVLLALKEREPASPEEIAKAGKFKEIVEVMNAASWLVSKGLVTMRERVQRHYRLAKRQWATKALPERRLLKELRKAHGKSPVDALRRRAKMGEADFSIALGWMRRKGWATVERAPDGAVVAITDRGDAALGEKGRDEEVIARLAKGELSEDEVDPAVLKDLRSRHDIVVERESVRREIALRDAGRRVLAGGVELKEEVAQLTPELLRTGRWKEVEIRPYDVRAFAPTVHPGKAHILSEYIERIRGIFLSMGFTEIQGDYVQNAFWVFDALFQPQDHPARDVLDTMYVDVATPPGLPADELVRRVAEVHETGGRTGSEGWRYRWSHAEAERAVLRPHTTPITLRYLADHPDPPRKAFIIGRNFRRDALDWKHLPEFHQIEGVVMEEGASLSMLLGTIAEFYRRMGLERILYRPGYFPYTEPSMEPEGQLADGRWIELGGSGIFRVEVTEPLGLGAPVLAWGLGLERFVMAREGLTDIRQLYFSDIDWLRNRAVVR